MLAGRGVAVLGTGLLMWLAARLIGSPGLEVVAIGIAALPFLAAGAPRRGAPPRHGAPRRAARRGPPRAGGARRPGPPPGSWCTAVSRTSASPRGRGCT